MSYYDGEGNLLDTDFSVTDTRLELTVEKWLDEHPEATTTVRDGVVTPEKTSFMQYTSKMLKSKRQRYLPRWCQRNIMNMV